MPAEPKRFGHAGSEPGDGTFGGGGRFRAVEGFAEGKPSKHTLFLGGAHGYVDEALCSAAGKPHPMVDGGANLPHAEVEVGAKKLEEKRVDPSSKVVDEKENAPRAQLKILIPIPAVEEGSPGEKEEEENNSTKDQEDLAMLLMSAKD